MDVVGGLWKDVVVCHFPPPLLIFVFKFRLGWRGNRGASAVLVAPLLYLNGGCCLLKNWGVKLMEDGGDSGWIEQTDGGNLKKKKKKWGVCLTHSARGRAVLAGRFLILGAQFFVDALCRGGKPQRGRRIVLNIDHIIIIIIVE